MENEVRISHENSLWKWFRIMVEETVVPPDITEKIKDQIQKLGEA